MASQLRVSIEGFAREIQGDLPRLIKLYPMGIYFSYLSEEYGESTARIIKAIGILKERNVLEVHQAASNAYYIMPAAYTPPEPLVELTDLQRKLVYYLFDVSVQASNRLLSTNFSRLSKVMGCSYGGLVTAVNRLEVLQYIEVRQHTPLILYLTDKLWDQLLPS